MKINYRANPTRFLLLFVSLVFLSACGTSPENLIGKEYDMNDGFHVIEFKSETMYRVYQKPFNCGGDGSWSINDGKVVLGPNDSNCESTRNLAGTYEVSSFK